MINWETFVFGLLVLSVLKEGNTVNVVIKFLFTLRPQGILSFCEIPSYALVHMFCQFEKKR